MYITDYDDVDGGDGHDNDGGDGRHGSRSVTWRCILGGSEGSR